MLEILTLSPRFNFVLDSQLCIVYVLTWSISLNITLKLECIASNAQGRNSKRNPFTAGSHQPKKEHKNFSKFISPLDRQIRSWSLHPFWQRSQKPKSGSWLLLFKKLVKRPFLENHNNNSKKRLCNALPRTSHEAFT